jgi:hypothetical protein
MHLSFMAAYSSMKIALAHLSLTAREEVKKDEAQITNFLLLPVLS